LDSKHSRAQGDGGYRRRYQHVEKQKYNADGIFIGEGFDSEALAKTT